MRADSGADRQSNGAAWKRTVAWLSLPLGRTVAAITATLLWGSAFPFVKVGYATGGIHRDDVFAQILFAGYRFILAGLMLCVLSTAVGRRPLPQTSAQAGFAFRLAIIQTVLQYLFFYIGIALSSGISASILAGTLTFFQLVIAHARHADDKLSVRKVLSAVVGFAAIVAYHMGNSTQLWTFGLGELCLLAAMFFAAFGNVMNRNSSACGWSPLPLTGFQMLTGGLALMLIGGIGSGFRGLTISTELFEVLVYLSLVSASSFLLWNSLMTFNRAGAVSVYLFLVPIFGVLLSAYILNEPVNPRVFPVLAVVVMSIFVAQRAESERPHSVITRNQ